MRAMNPAAGKRTRGLVAATAIVAISRALLVPRTPFELDEFLFMQSVVRFEPLAHHPHPPGYPLIAGLGKLVAAFGLDPFHALVTLSVISSVIGFVALALAFRAMLRDEVSAIGGAVLFYFSPAMLVDSTLPMSDPPALMFLALALWMAARLWSPGASRHSRTVSAILFGAFASASIGCRPQYAIAILPMLAFVVIALAIKRRWRDALVATVAFTAVSLVWFVPLVVATGGIEGFLKYELRQASYVAQHDSFLSRSGRTHADIALRFIAHPWGPKWLSLPLLLLALAGAIRELRARNTLLVPLAIVAGVHLAFSIVATDPADGVRYVLPSVILVAYFAIAGVQTYARRWAQAVIVVLLVIGSFVYVAPILLARGTTDSPPVRAATWAQRNLPANAGVLYDQSLEPHAHFLLDRFNPMPVERGLAVYTDRPDIPLVLFADGGTAVARTQTFEWDTESDAFGKLTRNHYFTVTLIPLPPNTRFVPLTGVSAPERTRGGEEWRWLAPLATLRLPRAAARRAEVVLRLPPESAIDSNEVTITVNGAATAHATVQRGRSTTVDVPLSGPSPFVLVFRSARGYVPATESSSRDPRKLGVQLVSIVSE